MIKRIHIENFRSIENLEIKPQEICALIGPNSTGKTNILKALNILLGESYPTERAFTNDDFHKRNSSNPIKIGVELFEPLKPVLATAHSGGKSECSCISMYLTYSVNEEGSTSSFTCYNYGDHRPFYGNGKIRDQISFIYIPSERNFEKQLTISKWSIIGKILSKVDENFKKSTERTQEFKEAMSVPKKILEQEIEGEISYSKFKSTFVNKVKINTIGHTNGCDLNLEIYDPLWYYKMIQITALENDNSYNISEIGAGTQNLFLLSLFQTFAELMKDNAILAIEEPELYLFPFAQRRLYNEFIKLSSESQIFYTTHSPNFVSIIRCDDATILRKKEGKTECLNTKPLDKFLAAEEKNKVNLISKFNSSVNEIFFADKVILVEGQTEEIVLPHIIKKLTEENGNDINYIIINCLSKTSIPFFIKVCNFLGIDNYFTIFDSDLKPGKGEQALKSAQHQTDKILDLTDGDMERFLILEYDFESACGYEIGVGSKTMSALNWVENLHVSEIPECFIELKNYLLSP